jgi:hypothetical protein
MFISKACMIQDRHQQHHEQKNPFQKKQNEFGIKSKITSPQSFHIFHLFTLPYKTLLNLLHN